MFKCCSILVVRRDNVKMAKFQLTVKYVDYTGLYMQYTPKLAYKTYSILHILPTIYNVDVVVKISLLSLHV
jgi:hypothetical protein